MMYCIMWHLSLPEVMHEKKDRSTMSSAKSPTNESINCEHTNDNMYVNTDKETHENTDDHVSDTKHARNSVCEDMSGTINGSTSESTGEGTSESTSESTSENTSKDIQISTSKDKDIRVGQLHIPNQAYAQLEQEIQHITWSFLQPHAQRGALFWVDESVDLVEVAWAIAHDQVDYVQTCLSKQTICKAQDQPLPEALAYRFIIVQPYVLAMKWSLDLPPADEAT